MEILILFLIVYGSILLIFVLSAVFTLFSCGHQSDFKRVYKDLPNRKFYLKHTQIYSHNYAEDDDGFVWFINLGSFKVSKYVYLHNNFITYLSPFHLYWFKKYTNWFKKNVKIENVNEY